MGSDDVTVKVLIEIRDEIRELRGDVRGVQGEVRVVQDELRAQGKRIDETNERLDQTNARLDGLTNRVVESEVRTATAINDVAGTLGDVKVMLRDRFDLRDRVEQCERDIAELKHRDR